jgi:hypothetical protein
MDLADEPWLVELVQIEGILLLSRPLIGVLLSTSHRPEFGNVRKKYAVTFAVPRCYRRCFALLFCRASMKKMRTSAA